MNRAQTRQQPTVATCSPFTLYFMRGFCTKHLQQLVCCCKYAPLHDAPFAARPQARAVARGDHPVVVPHGFVQFLESGVWVTHSLFRLIAERALLAHEPLHQIKGHTVVRVVADHLQHVAYRSRWSQGQGEG